MNRNRAQKKTPIKQSSTSRALSTATRSGRGPSNSLLALSAAGSGMTSFRSRAQFNTIRTMSTSEETSNARLPKRRYVEVTANSLLEKATKAGGDIYAPLSHFKKFETAARILPDFKDVLNHPMPSAQRKKQIVNDFFNQIGADNTTNEFFQTLAVDGRLSLANDILDSYRKKAAQHNKDSLATIISAEPLSADQMDQVRKGLTPHVPKGYKLQLIPKIDPSILGGVIVQSDDFYQDLSLATAYKALEAEVESSVNIQ